MPAPSRALRRTERRPARSSQTSACIDPHLSGSAVAAEEPVAAAGPAADPYLSGSAFVAEEPVAAPGPAADPHVSGSAVAADEPAAVGAAQQRSGPARLLFRHNGSIVSKLLGSSFIEIFGDEFSRYTEIVNPRDIAYTGSLRYCPMVFQAYIPKELEVRVTVVGRQVFAAEIHSQASNHTRGDWRRYDNFHTPYCPANCPSTSNGAASASSNSSALGMARSI